MQWTVLNGTEVGAHGTADVLGAAAVPTRPGGGQGARGAGEANDEHGAEPVAHAPACLRK